MNACICVHLSLIIYRMNFIEKQCIPSAKLYSTFVPYLSAMELTSGKPSPVLSLLPLW